ncbi:MAG: tetratricopeptide repeat protein, partial [Oscillospiraceae bacterium]
EKDQEKSDEYFKRAFISFLAMDKQNSDDKTEYRIGWMYQNGVGTDKDINKAKEYFEKSAKLGNEFSMYSLAKIILSEENPTKEEFIKAIEYLNKSAEKGNQSAQYTIGKIYYEGKIVPKDITKAMKLLYLSAQQGNEWANYTLGKIYLSEVGYIDITKAIEYLNKSAESGNQFAQYALGKIYLQGAIVPKDVKMSIKYFMMAAEQNNSNAEYQLGKIFFYEKEVKDINQSRYWLNISIKNGNIFAQNLLNYINNPYSSKNISLILMQSILDFFCEKNFNNNKKAFSKDLSKAEKIEFAKKQKDRSITWERE